MTTTSTPLEIDDDKLPSAQPDEYVPVGLDGLLGATQKALAITRGLEDQDHRDGLHVKRIMNTADLLAERVSMDAAGDLRKMMQYAARHRSLKGFMPGALDKTMEGHLLGNPLSSPLEEVNPLDVGNQARRVTLMGPGGISSTDMITPDMAAVHSSTFGFLSAVEGPECFDAASQVYTKRGWVLWPDVLDTDVFACRINGVLEWHPATRVVREHYSGEMLLGENESIRMCVTPTHRVLCARSRQHYRMEQARDIYGKTAMIPVRHEPETGDTTLKTFQLPSVEVTVHNQRIFGALDLDDWAEFLGWWLAEGSHSGRLDAERRAIRVHQCPEANPEKYARLRALLLRLQFITSKVGLRQKAFSLPAKQLCAYFSQWTEGCYNKWIPEECFDWPVKARQRLLEGLLLGDGRWNRKRISYCTISQRLARSVERLAVGLGYPAFIREEKDSRPHVTTTNYVVALSRAQSRTLKGQAHKHTNGKSYGNYWSKVSYDGFVYCATVPGGLLLVRGKEGNAGFWSGNSELAGIDTRFSENVRIGSNGRPYQLFRDPRTGHMHWLSPEDLRGKVIGMPRRS